MRKVKNLKTKVKEIVFEIVEWEEWQPQREQYFFTWDRVNQAIEVYQTIAPDNGSYFKCDYKVTWEDGETWTSRYDMTRDSGSLGEDVKSCLIYYSGRLSDEDLLERKLSREEYMNRINTFWNGKYSPEDVAKFFDTHALED